MKPMTHALRFAAALALTVAGLAGCDDGIQRTSSADIYTEPPIQPNEAEIWTTTLYFERAALNRTNRQELTIGHSGEDALVVSDIYIEGLEDCDRVKAGISPMDSFPGEQDARCFWSIDERPELPLTLENLAFSSLQIAYKNTGMPPSPATLVIISNALDKQRVEVELRLQDASPRIGVSPPTTGFPVGGGNSFINVRNSGSATLTVTNFRVDLLSDAAIDPATQEPVQEYVVSANRDLPWIIEPQQSLSLEVDYTPFDDTADRAEVIFESDDPQQPQVSVTLLSSPLTSDLVVTPNPVVFGAPMGNNDIVRPISLTNAGLAPLDVLSMTVEQGVEAFRVSGQTSFQIQGGASRMVDVVFSPQSAEGSDATLVIESNASNLAADGARLLVPLLRSAAEVAALEIDPLTVEMNRVAAGASEDATITLSNPGGLPLEVTRIGMTTDDDAPLIPSDPEYSVTAGGGMTTIAAGGEHAVTVRFTRGADDNNLHIGSLIIESDSPTSPDVVRFTSRPVGN